MKEATQEAITVKITKKRQLSLAVTDPFSKRVDLMMYSSINK